MKKTIVITLFLGLLMSAGLAQASGWRHSWTFQTENVVAQDDAPAFGTYYGAANLQRTRYGISGRIMTNVENAGEPYTVWIVIFNRPQFCATSPCTGADLPEFVGGMGDPRVDVAVLNASGSITGSDGNGGGVLNLDFSAKAGRVPEGLCCFGKLARRNGLKAEVHIVVDKHPPPTDPMDETYWITHLNTPFMGHRFAIFLPTH